MYQAFGEVYWLLAEFDVPIWLMGVFSQEIGGVDKTTTSGQRQKKTSHLGVEKSQILISFSLLYFHSSGPPYLNPRFASVCRRPSGVTKQLPDTIHLTIQRSRSLTDP